MFNQNKDKFIFTVNSAKKTWTLVCYDYEAILYIAQPLNIENLKKIKKEIESAPSYDIAFKWMRIALQENQGLSMSVTSRPTWCSSYYDSKEEYTKEMRIHNKLLGQKPYVLKKYYNEFLTFEEWSDKPVYETCAFCGIKTTNAEPGDGTSYVCIDKDKCIVRTRKHLGLPPKPNVTASSGDGAKTKSSLSLDEILDSLK